MVKSEFDKESDYLSLILLAHRSYVDRVRNQTRVLSEEAAEATSEGIRDLVDEDAEVDSAAQAAMVRQASNRAIYSLKRLRDLEAQPDSLAFGKIVSCDGDQVYIGRRSVIESDRVLLVDWRANAAIPFYRATSGKSLGMKSRRHFFYDDELLSDYSDEVFATSDLEDADGLRGEAALLASLDSPTDSHMKSVVSTIQADQDQIIRSPYDKPLVVQGSAGTGKTVIALHRAAYLLYEHRVDLADVGVLIIGPSKRFLNYISQVVPSLGESGVISSTVEGLYRGVKLGFDEPQAVSNLKGSIQMASLLERYLKLRKRIPNDVFTLWYGSSKVVVSIEELRSIFNTASSYKHHNEAADVFRSLLVNLLVEKTFSPSFDTKADLKNHFERSKSVRKICLKYLPRLSAVQALNDLFGSKALLSASSKGLLPKSAQGLLFRKRALESELDDRAWADSDVPLLDELSFLLNGLVGDINADQLLKREVADQFEDVEDDSSSVDLAEFFSPDDNLDPLDATDFWKFGDEVLGLSAFMYDQVESEVNANLKSSEREGYLNE